MEPKHLTEALARYAQEGERGIDWTFHQSMTRADREAFDTWLLTVKHPITLEPSTQEYRFKHVVRETARRMGRQ